MKVLFIEARRNDLKLDPKIVSKLPENFSLLYSIQYKSLAESIKKIAEKSGKKINSFKQILGCTLIKIDSPAVLVGSGKFHALQIALQTKFPIYIVEENKLIKLEKKEIEEFRRKRLTAIKKFLSAESIGILISTKPGQKNMKKAEQIKQKLDSKNKKGYLLIAETISIQELENFNFDIFVNTACPGLQLDSSKIVNLEEVTSYL